MARHRPDRSRKNQGSQAEPAEKYGDEAGDEAPAWLSRAAERYERRQEGYASLFAGAREAVKNQKDELSGLLRKDEPDEKEAAPAIFDEAHQAYQERQSSLASMFDDALKARQKERDALSNIFGSPSSPRRKPPGR